MRNAGTVDQVAEIYGRAARFVPSSEPSARLAFALVEEELGHQEEARKQYQTVLKCGKFSCTDIRFNDS